MQSLLDNIDRKIIDKYDRLTSFYTDFPPLGLWMDSRKEGDYIKALSEAVKEKERSPRILYLHFPYCPRLCTYCQCYHLITQDHKKVKEFLKHLYLEIELLDQFFKKHSYKPFFKEIHLGGGSPSFLDTEEFDELMENLKKIVDFNEVVEFTIEIDPRQIDRDRMFYYHKKGINRVSFGVQDFDPDVQKAVNRIQPPEMLKNLLTPDIRKLFKTVNFDIIFGLPRQTRESFKKTIDTVIELSPDRIALCVLGYRPDIFNHQNSLVKSEIPDAYERMMINIQALQDLMDNGYLRIGIDHLAKLTDDLGIALKSKRLHRNALGYTPGRCIDIIGLGPSSMTRLGDYYFQNMYSLEKYYRELENNRLPILRGYKVNKDQIIRRDIMHELLKYFIVSFKEIEERYNIDFKTYFDFELKELSKFVEDGFIKVDNEGIRATTLGTLFLRFVCKVFDNLHEDYKHSRETVRC